MWISKKIEDNMMIIAYFKNEYDELPFRIEYYSFDVLSTYPYHYDRSEQNRGGFISPIDKTTIIVYNITEQNKGERKIMFTAFLIVAIWLLPLPTWLQIVLTVLGSLKVLVDLVRETRN